MFSTEYGYSQFSRIRGYSMSVGFSKKGIDSKELSTYKHLTLETSLTDQTHLKIQKVLERQGIFISSQSPVWTDPKWNGLKTEGDIHRFMVAQVKAKKLLELYRILR